ncbi:PREDICTED: protein SMAX1-LIKE 3-like [Nicotiana attenuata]|uniref:Protein smax1-like 3 n=1 Tax=Nicotiana attenuata TaxID=49451 RepID=A0A314LC00_NICAT|nr:PREDICTED: protein SMAX1-LIKE 3-like [Nicotiana attenuata]OIT39250.1 protein smax1-like 3 [Nicotiana attenuata]
MRTGGCTIQQALTTEAAAVVKQAVQLAKRRGHAQVTPLHVANTMLSSSNGILKTACLQSHSHPLQCKALELCFNVALNRLPASSSSPMLLGHGHHHQSQYPSISNALIAAFKRAQAHQRRGSIENQQQPLLAVKIELEQLIISILDDPSVSRVMREAGFSSPQVKSNVEQAISLEICSQSPPPNSSKENSQVVTSNKVINPIAVKDEDVMSVVESLMNKRKKSIVIVGECLDSLEGVIKGVMNKVDNRDVPQVLKEVKFISLPLLTFGNIQREEVEQRIGELTCLVKSLAAKGVVLYLGDLKWIADFRVNSCGGQGRISYYCSVEHMIMEIGRLVCSFGENQKIWLVGIATFQTYMRCKSGNNSLESIWGLHPVTLPGGSLGLSLKPDSDTQNSAFNTESTLSSLPSWLKDHEKQRNSTPKNDQNCVSVKELHNKWITTCSSIHKDTKSLSFPSSDANLDHNLPFWANRKTCETSLRIYIPDHNNDKGNNVALSSSNSSDVIMEMELCVPKLKEFNSENLNILSNALEEIVPWQKEIIQEIAATILQCRSGMIRRKEKIIGSEAKEETWLFFQGPDVEAKEKIARELAKIVFGSYSNFVSIPLSSFKADSTEDFRNKRSRNEQSWSYIDKFAQAVVSSNNSHCVFYLEDIEQVDYFSQRGIKKAIERGIVTNSSGEELSLNDAIIILSCENFSSKSRASSPTVKQKSSEETTTSPCVSLDLNISIDYDQERDEDLSNIDDIWLLHSVDRCIFFQNSRAVEE